MKTLNVLSGKAGSFLLEHCKLSAVYMRCFLIFYGSSKAICYIDCLFYVSVVYDFINLFMVDIGKICFNEVF